jgi:hypothetical protein
MFNIEELKRYNNNVLITFKKTLKRDLKKYLKDGNNTLYQLTMKNINDISYILEARGEK